MGNPPEEEGPARTDDGRSAVNGTNPSDAPSVLELDEVFAALSHPRRRYLLYTLINETSEETLPELATRIAAWEGSKPTDEVTDDERRRVHVSLYHQHVPRLAELGIVEYHRAEDVIVRANRTEQVQAVLDGAGAELDSRQETHARRRDVHRDDADGS